MTKPYTYIPTELAEQMKAHLSWLPELRALLQEEGLQVSEQELLRLALSFCVFVPVSQDGKPPSGKDGEPHDEDC